jgi:CRP/FNR family transcriptional regulator
MRSRRQKVGLVDTRSLLEKRMKVSLVAPEPIGQFCGECSVRQFSICAALCMAELREFTHFGRCIPFAPGETVFAQEELATSFCSVLDGIMRLYKLLPDGRRQIVGFALPGDFLGMNVSGRHNFSADAIGSVAICRFPRAAFGRFIEDKPHLLRRINELAARELSQARNHMVLLGRRSAEEKVATFLLGWRDRLARLNGPSQVISLPMSRQDIADYLGLTIETVSRTLTRLERDGVIEILPHHGISIVDTERVAALATA